MPSCLYYENGSIFAQKPDGIIEITHGSSNLPPGETGMQVGMGHWVRVNDGEWIRGKEKSTLKLRNLAQEASSCKEFLEKVNNG